MGAGSLQAERGRSKGIQAWYEPRMANNVVCLNTEVVGFSCVSCLWTLDEQKGTHNIYFVSYIYLFHIYILPFWVFI